MMAWTTTDVLIFAVAAYLAVVTLVRLMRNRRDELVTKVRSQMQAERGRHKKPAKNDQDREEAA
jgi:hypothetical protein